MIYKRLTKPQLLIGISTALLLSVLYLSLNFNYLSRFIDEKGDCLTYDYYVRLGIPQYLFNPHHIGFDWAGEQFYNKLKEGGYTGSVMVALQLRNLIVSALSLGLIFFLFYKISRHYLLSLLLVLSYAFTAAYWMYSQINDTPIIHSTLVFLLFLAALYFPQAKHKVRYSLILGFFHAIIIFFHQSDLIMAAPILFIMMFYQLFYRDAGGKRFDWKNIRYVICYGLIFSIVVVVAYYYVGIILIGLTFDKSEAQAFNMIKDSTYFFNWLILYAKIDHWGKGFENTKALFPQVVEGISTYFYQPQSPIMGGGKLGFDFSNFFGTTSILPNLIGLLFITVFGGSLLLLPHMVRRYGYALIACILFMGIYTTLTCWWEADYREFWVAPMFSFWFLCLMFFTLLFELVDITKPLVIITSYSYLFLLVALLFYFNFTGFILPNATKTYKSYDITTPRYEPTQNVR